MKNEVTPLMAAFAVINKANLKDLEGISAHLSQRLFTLRDQSCGMKAANLEEAANFMANATVDIGGAMRARDEVCNCGKCDGCAAARSDEHYDRKRDGELGA